MPRGFLVKRTRKPGGSYRIPCEESGSAQTLPGTPVLEVLAPFTPIIHTSPGLRTGASERETQPPTPREDPQVTREVPQVRAGGGLAQLGHWSSLPYSPVQPVGLEMKKNLFKRYMTSPPTAESFPVTAAFPSMEKLISQHHNPFLTPEAKLHANLCSREATRAIKFPLKKHKASRKLHFTDEVTTSPVLGLRIKAEEPESKSRSPLVKRPPLGEFICQLCKEQYPDPFALAQHKCSRIVRVEYRCPECDKIFSCPANLASHRRWHKPKTLGSDGQVGKKIQMPLEGKENSEGRHSSEQKVQHQQSVDSSQRRDQHLQSVDSSQRRDQHLQTTVSQSTSEESEEEAFHCPYCHKRFRRHAYLRKHLLTHQPYSPLERGQLTFPCALCGVHFPSMDIRDKHRLWHAVREELLLPLEEALVAEGGQQIFPCELCPTAFFSSPGLALHMNKCHSAEGRQELPPPIPLAPGY
ncbi:insulinoma-associated protein 2 [Hyperolius riggenbachi]|uniref:insulinoma-associated protein 2 n=1 Tax=Hyperolius riggenbachi TaxID=752182 RepID=UPI0035A2DEB4